MADDLSLLLRIRGDSTGAKAATTETRNAISQLRASSTADLKAIQTASTTSLGSITQSAGQITQSIPVLGRVVNSLSNAFTTMTDASAGAATGVASLAGPLSIAVVGMIATAAAAVKLGQGLFGLAKQTAEFQGKLFDLSQQTGVSVETLSALEVVARTTGGSIESITASLGIFQKNLEESLDTESKAAEAFKRLGVEVTDTEKTFRDTLAALAKMPEGFRQTALALELFGRGGKQVLAILKETNGDLDGTIRKLEGLGLVTSAQARRADEFNDKLVLLDVALRGLGTEAIPLIIEVLDDLQKTIEENRDAFDLLKTILGVVTALVVGPVKGGIVAADKVWESHRAEVNLVTEAYQILEGAIRGAIAEIPKQPLVTGATSGLELLEQIRRGGILKQFPLTPQQDFSKIPGLFKEAEAEAKKRLAEAESRANKDIQLQQQRLEESTRAHRVTLERERDLDLKSIDEWELEAEKLVNDHRETQEGLLDQELAAVRRFVKGREDLLLAETAIQQRRTELTNKAAEDLQRIDDEAQRRRDVASLALEQQLAAIRETEREGELNRIKAALDRKEIAESDAITRRLALEKQAQEDRIVLIDAELALLTTSAARQVELNNLKIQSEQEFTDKTKLLIQERIDAREEEIRRNAPGAQGVPEGTGIVDLSGLGEAPEAPINNLSDAFDRLGLNMSRVFGIGQEQGQAFADSLKGVVADIAFGVGDLVQQWVLLGSTGPAAMRKLTASVLAGLAAQAAVKAIFQLAEGFAALFFNPAQAAAHFKAAALFGAVAVAAGVAGRGLAGGLFSGASGGAGAGSDRSGPPQPLQTIVQGRNQASERRIVIEVRPDGSKFGQAINAHIVSDMGDGGELREVLQTDGRSR